MMARRTDLHFTLMSCPDQSHQYPVVPVLSEDMLSAASEANPRMTTY